MWAVLTEIERWPSWNPAVESVSFEGGFEEGSEFRWKAGPGTITSTIRDVDAPRRTAWTGTSFGIKAIHVHTLESRNGGTLVRTKESYAGVVASLLRRPLRRMLDSTLQGELEHLKAEAERQDRGRRRQRDERGRGRRRGEARPRRARATGLGRTRPRLSARAVLAGWLLATAGLLTAAVLLPGLRVDGILGASRVAAAVGVLNALIVPAIARIRLPLTILSGFVLVLALDAAVLWFAAKRISGSITVDTFGWAIAGALVAAAATLTFQIAVGVNNDDTYSLRVIERMARRSGKQVRTARRASSSSRSTGWQFPCSNERYATATRPRWRGGSRRGRTGSSSGRRICRRRRARARPESCSARTTTYRLSGGSRRRPARLMTCSAPRDCKEIERRHTNGCGPARRRRHEPWKPPLGWRRRR